MPSVKIRVGASVDSSVANAFTQVTKAAAQAAATIKTQMGAAGAATAKSVAAGASAASGSLKQTGSAATQAAKSTQAAAAASAAAMGALATGTAEKFKALQSGLRGIPADLKTVTREAQRALQAMERGKARAALGLGGGGAGGGGRNHSRYWYPGNGNWNIRKPTLSTLNADPVSGVAGFGMGAASYLGRAAIGLARSIGVQTDFGELIGRSVADEKTAQQISSSGYFPGQEGPAGRRVQRGDLLDETRKIGIDTGTERSEVLEGLRDFVGKTGDLQLGRDLLADMAKLSRATGSNMADMVNASAEVSNALGNVEGKGAVVKAVMMQIAGQGKLGAIEIRDLATQMAKLASQAGKFEGGAAKNVGILGMLAQEAKLRGGAANSAQATTSVQRFVDTLTKSKTNKTLSKVRWTTVDAHGKKTEHRGLNVFTDASKTELRDPREIIKDMLSASGGNLQKLNEMMPGTIGNKPIQALAQIYNQASGPDSDKIAAVNAELDHMASAILSEQEVQRAFSASMETSDAKVKTFNEQMGAVAEEMAASLLPAMVALAPAFIELGTAAAGLMAKILGIDPNADKEARKRRTRADLPEAVKKQLEQAEGRAPLPGEDAVAWNAEAQQWVGTHGTIAKDAEGQLANQQGDIAGELASKEAALKKYEADHLQGMFGSGGRYQGYSQGSLDEIHKQEADIGQLKEQQVRTVDILHRIHDALLTGKVTTKREAPAGGLPPPTGGAMPAETQ